MPLESGYGKKVISHNIREMKNSGHSQKQSVAASLHNADKFQSKDHKAKHKMLMKGK